VSIDCNNYDYIEIACMHQYPIKLTLRTQSIVEGIALDTQLNASREECIKLMSDGEERLIVFLCVFQALGAAGSRGSQLPNASGLLANAIRALTEP